jgi:hypothetical protein
MDARDSQRDADRDEALSALTDAVIGGKPAPMTSITQETSFTNETSLTKDYEQLIRAVNALTNSTPSPEFRTRLTDRLNQEWDAVQREKRMKAPAQPWIRRSRNQYLLIAAAAVVLVVGAILVLPGKDQSLNIPGLTFGNAEVPTLIVGVLIAGAVVVGLIGRRRK